MKVRASYCLCDTKFNFRKIIITRYFRTGSFKLADDCYEYSYPAPETYCQFHSQQSTSVEDQLISSISDQHEPKSPKFDLRHEKMLTSNQICSTSFQQQSKKQAKAENKSNLSAFSNISTSSINREIGAKPNLSWMLSNQQYQTIQSVGAPNHSVASKMNYHLTTGIAEPAVSAPEVPAKPKLEPRLKKKASMLHGKPMIAQDNIYFVTKDDESCNSSEIAPPIDLPPRPQNKKITSSNSNKNFNKQVSVAQRDIK